MRVALITPGFSASAEDWCLPAVRDLVEHLARAAEVVVFALRYPHRRATYQVVGARVRSLGGGQRRGLARGPLLVRCLGAVGREHRRRPFDVIHALWAHEPGFLAVTAGRLLRVPVVVSVLGGELTALPEIGYGGGLSRANRWLVWSALHGRHPVTVGSAVLDRQAASRVATRRLVRLPLGVDVERFSPGADRTSPPLAGQLRLLRVGALTAVKAPGTLLEAFRRVAERHSSAHLHLVGDGPLRGELEERLLAHGLAGRVTLHGEIPHHHLPEYYRQAHLCVQSSAFESQAMVVLEAAACGVATVGTAVGILPELVEERWLASPGDPARLAAVLLDAMGDPSARTALGARLRRAVRAGLTVEATAGRLGELYRRATGPDGG